MAKLALDIRDVRKSYGDFQVLKGVNLEVESGTIFALLGPNGAGKTTLLHIVTTLLKPDAGSILIEGFDSIKFPKKAKELIGIVGQYASVDDQLTGLENLTMFARLHHLSSREAAATAQKLLQKFKLTEAAHRVVGTYSGGMRRRLDLAASLVSKPRILFLDEPTTGLDLHSREVLWEIIRELSSDGTTIFLTTQYLEEADQLADKVAIINHGTIIALNTVHSLKNQVGEEYFSLVLKTDRDVQAIKNNLGGIKAYVDEALKTINFPISNDRAGIETVRLIADLILKSNVAIERYDVHMPTLDDVFRALTKPAKKME